MRSLAIVIGKILVLAIILKAQTLLFISVFDEKCYHNLLRLFSISEQVSTLT